MAKYLLLLNLFFISFINSTYSFTIEFSNGKDACVKTCENGASCTKTAKYEFCKCLPGTFGDNCGIVPDCEDDVIICAESSNSVCGYNVQQEEAECICENSNLAYDKSTEACRETCALDTDCINGAKCTTSGSYKFCKCLPGTNGHRCEKVEDCDKNLITCKQDVGAVCGYNTTLKKAECLCSDRKQEYDLETEQCRETCGLDTECKNAAKCTTIGSYKFCKCLPGTNGHKCDRVYDCDKNFLTCKEGVGAICGYNTVLKKAECICSVSNQEYDFETEQCRETCALDTDCKNGAKCATSGSYKFCKCLPGTNGHKCDKVEDCDKNILTCSQDVGAVCGYNATFKKAECLCPDRKQEYDLETEQCRETCALDTNCKNGAKCTTIGSYRFCKCSLGTYGHACGRVEDCDTNILTCKEGSGAVCGYNTTLKKAECLCSDSKEEYDLETEECRETCSLDSDCRNEAGCKSIGDYAFCDCLSGTHGHMCEKVTDCDNYKVTCKPGSGAYCRYNTRLKVAECQCSDSKIYDPKTKECRGTCNIDTDCENGAKCKTIGHYALCECPTGTYGHKCEKVADCENSRITCKEGSGATCGYNTELGTAECLCSGSKKYDKETEECRETCATDADCSNEAICMAIGNYAFCECHFGTYGHECEKVADCDNNKVTCKEGSGAACGFNNELKAAECLCPDSKKYDTEIEECRDICEENPNVCRNGASCETIGYYQFCECLNGTYGNYCENVTDCDTNYLTCNEESGAICGYNPSLQKAECLCGDNLTYDISTETCRSFTSTVDDDTSIADYTTSTFLTEDTTETRLPLLTFTFGYFSSTINDRSSSKQNTASPFATKVTTDLRETSKLVSTVTASSTFFTTDVGRTRNEISTTIVPSVNKCNVSFSICPKSSTECVPNGNDYYCKCKPGFRPRTGIIEEHNKISCTKKKCDCGINSYNCQWSIQDKKICSCLHGYSQMKGFCTDCHCGANSLLCKFDKKGRKLCGCKSGYYQRNETCSEMCTNDKDCQNEGICELESNGYFCQCKSPFKGDRCEINEACEYLSNTCNAIGATCQYIDVLRKGVCVCPPHRYFNDETNTCKDKYKSNSSLVLVLSIISGLLIVSTIILVIVFKKFRSNTNMK